MAGRTKALARRVSFGVWVLLRAPRSKASEGRGVAVFGRCSRVKALCVLDVQARSCVAVWVLTVCGQKEVSVLLA